MRVRPYLLAYMVGVAVPSLTIFVVAIFVAWFFFVIPPGIERAMIFPMAFNPFMWGFWNALYVRLNRSHHISIGWYGSGLALLLVAVGLLLAKQLQIAAVTSMRALAVLPPTMPAYYILWKYVVSFLNNLVGVGVSE